jgi:phage terminase large subunit
MDPIKVGFEVGEEHLALWERDFRYAFLMGGRGNGRSGTASRYVASRLLGKEYTRGAIMRAVKEDIRTSCWQELIDRVDEEGIRESLNITENTMHMAYGVNSVQAHGFRAGSGSQTAKLKSLAGYNLIWPEEAEEIGEAEFMKLDDSLRTTKGSIRIIFTLNTPTCWYAMQEEIKAGDVLLVGHTNGTGMTVRYLLPRAVNSAFGIAITKNGFCFLRRCFVQRELAETP